MDTNDLLSSTHKYNGKELIPYTDSEIADRRRVMKRVLKNTRFENCTDQQLDSMKVCQLKEGSIVTDDNGCEWKI